MDELQEIMTVSDELSVEQIINELIRPENIELKTEIPDVAALEKLRVLAFWCRRNGLDEGSDLILMWIANFLRDMVSSERKSRQEIIDALISYNEKRTQTFGDKLLGGPKA